MVMDDEPPVDLAFRFYLAPKARARANVDTNALYVGARSPTPEMLGQLEQAYRARGCAPVIFEETDDDGMPIFGNVAMFAGLMSLPDGELPTVEQADQFIAGKQYANWK
jgi:hypothetical protein